MDTLFLITFPSVGCLTLRAAFLGWVYLPHCAFGMCRMFVIKLCSHASLQLVFAGFKMQVCSAFPKQEKPQRTVNALH